MNPKKKRAFAGLAVAILLYCPWRKNHNGLGRRFFYPALLENEEIT